MATTYKTTVISQNSWHFDGSPVIERTCNHSHRTISGATRCLRQLTRRHPDGMYSAAWYHAHVRHADGSQLAEEELGAYEAALAALDGH